MKIKTDFNIDELKAFSEYKWFTDRERTVFNLYYIRGWKIEDIATTLNPPVCRRTVTTILQNIRKKVEFI